MELNLKRPLAFFDLETTGLNVATDRIIEICILKANPNETEETRTWIQNLCKEQGIRVPKDEDVYFKTTYSGTVHAKNVHSENQP